MSKSWRPARRESTRDKDSAAVEPNRPTEFEIQARLWSGLRALGINARGEVKCVFSGRSRVRFDIAVFEEGQLVGVIECKREGKHECNWTTTRQGARYSQYEVPVRFVSGSEGVDVALEDAAAGRLWSGP